MRRSGLNAAGISVFYKSFDRDTCVAGLRTPVGGHAIVGRFEIRRPLRVLDLTLDRHYAERMVYDAFMRGFHAEIRRAVVPGRETLDYLPTQVIAEYLWSIVDPTVDGIVFGSAQITGSANNVVLFPMPRRSRAPTTRSSHASGSSITAPAVPTRMPKRMSEGIATSSRSNCRSGMEAGPRSHHWPRSSGWRACSIRRIRCRRTARPSFLATTTSGGSGCRVSAT